MKEVNDMAGQHELIAENLQDEVIREVTILVKDMKEDRKKVLGPSCFEWKSKIYNTLFATQH